MAHLIGELAAATGIPKVVVAGVGALSIFASAATGVVWGLEGAVETDATIDGGHGTVKEWYNLAPFECHGGYKTHIADAMAKFDHRVNIGPFHNIPTSMSASETFNGDLMVVTCNAQDTTQARAQETIDDTGKQRKITLALTPDAFSTIVYQVDPSDDKAFTSDNGLLWSLAKDFANTVKALPGGLDFHGPDALDNKERGWALEAAMDTATKACGPTAFSIGRDAYAQELTDEIVHQNNMYNKQRLVSNKNVTVEMPEAKDMHLSNQYSADLAKTKDLLKKNGIVVTAPSASKAKCEADPNAKVAPEPLKING